MKVQIIESIAPWVISFHSQMSGSRAPIRAPPGDKTRRVKSRQLNDDENGREANEAGKTRQRAAGSDTNRSPSPSKRRHLNISHVTPCNVGSSDMTKDKHCSDL